MFFYWKDNPNPIGFFQFVGDGTYIDSTHKLYIGISPMFLARTLTPSENGNDRMEFLRHLQFVNNRLMKEDLLIKLLTRAFKDVKIYPSQKYEWIYDNDNKRLFTKMLNTHNYLDYERIGDYFEFTTMD